MKSVFFILITLGLNYSVFTQNNIIKTVYYEGGDSETKIQLRMDVDGTKKDMKLKLRYEDKNNSKLQGISNLINGMAVKDFAVGYLVFNEKRISGDGIIYYLTGSPSGVVAIKPQDDFKWVEIVFYKWDDFYEDFRKVKSYNLYKPVDGGKILNWLLKD